VLTKARIVVDGIVQGVGYRALVKQVARQLALKGLVRNLEDTKVEIFCEGQENNIRESLKQIDRKTEGKDVLGINVTGIECHWEGQSNYRPAWKKCAGFEIDYQVEGVTPVDKETLESQEFAKLYFTGFRDEMKAFRHETNKNFKTMDAKYGDISKELKEFRKTVKEFLDAFLERTKGKDRS
jgi:acylphosphatase